VVGAAHKGDQRGEYRYKCTVRGELENLFRNGDGDGEEGSTDREKREGSDVCSCNEFSVTAE